MSWHRRINRLFSTNSTEKKNRLDRRVRLRLEELETRTLLSASTAATSPLSGLTVQTNASTITPAVSSTFSGYTPQQLQAAYGIPSTINGKLGGTGETIAIVDAYNDPNIAKDLAAFDAKYGLATANLTVVNQNGSTTNLPASDLGWAVEESLDVEWAHAIAPGAKIVLVEANSSNLSDLLTAVNTATSKEGANVVSMSWGGSEFYSESNYDKYFTAPGVTYVASAGDSSAYFGPEWPASSPNVLAVGGTTLNLTSTNAIASESAWSASFSWYYGIEGGGGGISSVESTPSYQSAAGIANGGRSTPDVAWVANPSTGVSVYDSYGEPGWGYVGGTSAGAPAWAGIVAIADQQSIADGHGSLSTNQVQSTLYNAYSGHAGTGYSNYFHDITSGNNGYQATTGYDLATGLGSPKVASLISLLANPNSIAASTTASTTSSTTTTTTPTHHRTWYPADAQTTSGGTSSATALGDTGASGVLISIIGTPTLGQSTGTSSSSTGTVSNVSSIPLLIASPSLPLTGNAPLVSGSVNESLPQSTIAFGASGLNGSATSWRMSSLAFPSAQVELPAEETPGDSENNLNSPSAADAIPGESDASAEDSSVLDFTAPPLLDGDAGDASAGGEGGDGGSGE